tara:strand:+ start:199 stop:444 length:246 start_codon:yes stop_codon:yes gene_type:complete
MGIETKVPGGRKNKNNNNLNTFNMAIRNKELLLKRLELVEDKITVIDHCVKTNQPLETFYKNLNQVKDIVREVTSYIENEN